MKYKLILFFLCIHVTSYFSQCLPHEKELSIVIQPDFFASETSWELFENNNLILSGTHHGDSVCIDSTACILFVINDSGNDGLCCAFGNGYYEVFIQGNKIGNGAVFLTQTQLVLIAPLSMWFLKMMVFLSLLPLVPINTETRKMNNSQSLWMKQLNPLIFSFMIDGGFKFFLVQTSIFLGMENSKMRNVLPESMPIKRW